MKLTESKLRYAIRDLLWEASVSSSGDPDGDADDAAELRDIAADIESRARAGGDRGEAALSQAAIDHAGELGASQGRIPFLDWSQNVVDASSKMMGIEDIEDGYDPDTGEQIMPYDAWLKGIDPAVYAQSVDALAPGDEGADDWDEMKWGLNEIGILPGGKLAALLREAMYDENPQTPWVFGPEGYDKRPVLDLQAKSKADIGADSPPEVMIARAMAYRASELTNYQKEFDDEIFSDYAMRSYQDYVVGKAGDRFQALDSMLNRIDDGGWSDEDIMHIAMGGEYDPADFEENPEHPDDNAMRADHEWRQMAGDIPEDEPYVPHAKRPDYGDEPGPLSESRLMHLAGLLED